MNVVATILSIWSAAAAVAAAAVVRLIRAGDAQLVSPDPEADAPDVPDTVPADWVNVCGCHRHGPARGIPSHVPAWLVEQYGTDQ